MSNIIIGIDPGKNGGIAWILPDGSATAEKMPDTLKDLWDLFDSIRWACLECPRTKTGDKVIAYLETVHSSPQMGVKSAFTFGQGFGNLEMAVVGIGFKLERVRPQAWQKAMGCLTKGDKNVTKRRAQELFPQLKITHATADALLIAAYGAKQ